MKSYTDIEQSKKLAKILPVESADYFHSPDAGIVVTEPFKLNKDDETVVTAYKGAIPCWSLTALLSVLPLPDLIQDKADDELFWQCSVHDEAGILLCETYDNNPVDACVAMIERLHELKML